MSTRSMIFVKVSDYDLNEIVKPDKQRIYEKGITFEDVDGGEIPEAEVDKFPAVKLKKKYVGIYHHWDGYPDGVGVTLKNYFNNYQDALNLMLYGDESTINGYLSPYTLRGKGYKKKEDTPCRFYDGIPRDLYKECWAEYVYLFKNGEWYYSETFTDVEEYEWKKL